MAKSIPPTKMKMAWVVWNDHCGLHASGWNDLKEMEDLTPLRMTSVGYIVKETDTYITLVAHVHGSGSEHLVTRGQGDVCIMKCSIVKRRNIPQNWIS